MSEKKIAPTLVGSSKIKTSGAAINSSPMLTRRISPPLIPRRATSPIRVSATSDKPSCCMTSSARACLTASGMFSGSRRCAANRRVSRTVDVGARISDWKKCLVNILNVNLTLQFNVPDQRIQSCVSHSHPVHAPQTSSPTQPSLHSPSSSLPRCPPASSYQPR